MLPRQKIYLLKYNMAPTKKNRIDYRHNNLLHILAIFLIGICGMNIYLETNAEDLLGKAFAPSIAQETVINLGSTKNAVGNEILREGIGIDANIGKGCVINGNKSNVKTVQLLIDATPWYVGTMSDFCSVVMNWTREDSFFNAPEVTKEAPLIVKIAKWLLRLTIVLSITMILYNGVMYIIESAKWGEVKDATKNLGLIVWGILVALLSLWIINLISSIGMSTLK